MEPQDPPQLTQTRHAVDKVADKGEPIQHMFFTIAFPPSQCVTCTCL